MIAVVQRVLEASVTVEAVGHHAAIGRGLCVLLCAEPHDSDRDTTWMAGKLAKLRIFQDDAGKMNRSVQDVAGAMLIISQFTLAGDVSGGHRPSFIGAAPPDQGRAIYDAVCQHVHRDHGVPVHKGVFGAAMRVHLVNDGPVTIIVRSPPPPTAARTVTDA